MPQLSRTGRRRPASGRCPRNLSSVAMPIYLLIATTILVPLSLHLKLDIADDLNVLAAGGSATKSSPSSGGGAEKSLEFGSNRVAPSPPSSLRADASKDGAHDEGSGAREDASDASPRRRGGGGSSRDREIAYVVSILKCGSKISWAKSDWKERRSVVDAAAVLVQSIRLVSYPLHPSSRYRPKFYAIMYKSESDSGCVDILTDLGFDVVLRELPVPDPLSHLIHEYPKLREKFPKQRWRWSPRPYLQEDGCCGQSEFVKLRLFELMDHPVVVHLDIDTAVLRPLDELFDAIVFDQDDPRSIAARRHLVEGGLIAPTYSGIDGRGTLPRRIDAFYTKNWCSATPQTSKWVGVQGGFLVTRPSLAVYKELQGIIREGNYTIGKGEGSGWGASGYGRHIFGSMTFQGLMAYYYDVVGPRSGVNAVEVHRCKYNQMADNPRITIGSKYPRPTPLYPEDAGYRDGSCRDGRKSCDDVQCQTWPIEDTRSIHFTNCLKPWTCPMPNQNTTQERTCSAMHREWFRIKRTLDVERWESNNITRERPNGLFRQGVFLGYCNFTGSEGYISNNG